MMAPVCGWRLIPLSFVHQETQAYVEKWNKKNKSTKKIIFRSQRLAKLVEY